MSNVIVPAADVRTIGDTQVHALGARYVDAKAGRIYRYVKAGATALDPGKLVVNADLVANHTNQTFNAAAAVGDTVVYLNIGATAATQDQYRDGFLTVNDATGEGITYAVQGNSAASSSGVVTVYLKEPIKVALVASTSEGTLKPSNWSGVVISATDQADLAVGVPNVTITANYYGWVQTRGECAVLADEAVTKGQALTIGTGTAGAVEAQDAAGEPQIGVASEALVDTEYRSAFLTID